MLQPFSGFTYIERLIVFEKIIRHKRVIDMVRPIYLSMHKLRRCFLQPLFFTSDLVIYAPEIQVSQHFNHVAVTTTFVLIIPVGVTVEISA